MYLSLIVQDLSPQKLKEPLSRAERVIKSLQSIYGFAERFVLVIVSDQFKALTRSITHIEYISLAPST